MDTPILIALCCMGKSISIQSVEGALQFSIVIVKRLKEVFLPFIKKNRNSNQADLEHRFSIFHTNQ